MSDFNVEDPGEGSSSSAYPEITTPESNLDTIVGPDDAMSDHAEADDGKDSEESLPWEDVNLRAILLGDVDPDKIVPPKFGEDHSYPWTAAVRTEVPFPADWTAAKKAAAISPNSPYYQIPETPRVFPSDWTPAQIAAANSRTSPFYVAPGVPITNTTSRLPESPLPGLFSHVRAPSQVFQSGFGPSSPARSTSTSSTESLPQSVNPALLTQNPSHFIYRASSVSNSPLFTPSEPSIPTPQRFNPESMTDYHSQSATPSPLSPGATRSESVRLIENILRRRTDDEQRNDDDDDDGPRIWASIDQRPPPNKAVSRIAKFGNVHRQQTAEDDTLRPVAGPSSANDAPCTQCGQSINGLRADLSPQERMEAENRFRNEMEPKLREKLEGIIDIEQREKIGKLITVIENWKEDYDKLTYEKEQLRIDYEKKERNFTAKEMEKQMEFKNDMDEIVKKLENANTIDEKVYQMARLVSIRRAKEFPSFSQNEVEQQVQQLLKTQIPMIEASQRDKHQKEIDQLTKDFQAEMSRVQNEVQAKDDAMDEVQYQTQLAEKEREFEQQLAQNRQEYNDALAAKHQEFTQQFDNQLAETTRGFNLELARLQQELSSYTPSAQHDEYERKLAERDEEFRRQFDEKHQEYTNLLNEKQQELDNLRAEKEQRDNEPDIMDIGEHTYGQGTTEMAEESKEKFKENYRKACRQELLEEVTREAQEKNEAAIQARVTAAVNAAVAAALQKKSDDDAAMERNPSNLAEPQDPSKPVAEDSTPIDADPLDSVVAGFSNLAIADSSKPVDTQVLPKSDLAGSSAPVDTDSSKSDVIDFAQHDSLDPSKLTAADRSKSVVAESSKPTDSSSSQSAITDSLPPVDIQDSSKSAADQDSSKSTATDRSKSVVAEPPKPTDPTSSQSVNIDSSQPVDTQDSFKSAADQDSSNAAVVQDSSIPIESQVQDSSVAAETQVTSNPADDTNSSAVIDSSHPYKAKLDAAYEQALAKLRQQYEEARSKLQESLQEKFNEELAAAKQQIDERLTEERAELKQQYDREITAAHATHRADLEKQYEKDIESHRSELAQIYENDIESHRVKLEKTIYAETKEHFETDLEHLRTQLQDEYDAQLKQKLDEQLAQLQKQHDDEIKKMHTKSTESPHAKQKESFERNSPRKSGKTVGQDARYSDKADGEVVVTASKTDGSDTELLKVKKQLTELQDKYKLLQADFEAEQSSHSKLSEEHDSLAKKEQAVNKSLELANYQIKELGTVLEGTNATVLRQRTIISGNDRQLTQLRRQVGELQSELALAVKEAREANEDLEKLSLAGQEAEANVNGLKRAIEELRQTNDDLLSQISTKEPEPVEERLEVVYREEAGLQADLQRSTDQNDKLERQNESQRQEIRQTRAQLGVVQNELDTANSCLVALTRDLSEARGSTSGLVAEVRTLREDKAALEKAAALKKAALEKAALEKAALEKAALEKVAALKKAALKKTGSSQEDHLQIPRWLIRQLTVLVVVSSFFFCVFGFLCFLGLAAEREAQQWLGGNDLPRAAMVSPVAWGIGKGGIW